MAVNAFRIMRKLLDMSEIQAVHLPAPGVFTTIVTTDCLLLRSLDLFHKCPIRPEVELHMAF